MKSWIQVARELPTGGKTQIECPENCGSGEKLSVNNVTKSYWCNCYRCGFTDSEFKGTQTLEELRKVKELNDKAESTKLKLELPNDFTTEIPRHGRAWLFKAGITEEVWRSYNIGYSKSLDRVILPIFDDKRRLIWYQCRALLHGQKPKYLQPALPRDKIIFESRTRDDKDGSITVVEDILSAIRVGQQTKSVSLLGTKITTAQAAVLGRYDVVKVWLDPDRAGRDGAKAIRKTLSLVTDVINITSDKDPKELSGEEIRKCLKSSNRGAVQ